MDEKRILDSINSPEDLRALGDAELDRLSSEIREFLVEKVTVTGGHLASNLGVVELTLAMHRALDLSKDRIIFDVGHQSYVHKILTGRKDRFDTLRSGGGLSGFTNRDESEYDCFGAGHSSTSLSAALGFAEADKLCGSDAYTVCVVGDGAFTGGMIHEALNNCGNDLHVIIILNENEMSISKNIGHFASNMARMRAGRGYLKTKKATRNFVRHIPLIGGWLFRRIRNLKKWFKNQVYGSNYFEDLGLYYLGPVDGHDRAAVERLITEAKESGQSAVIHVKTVKGKGYRPAENDPGQYHGMPRAGEAVTEDFSSVAGNYLSELADEDDKICAITAAMAYGTGLSEFSEKHGDRFFDVGIAEAHAATFAAGLAANGMKPVFCVYSTFLQRAYDSLVHDIALQRLPVTLLVDRAGLNSGDGATHHGIFDVSFLSGIPGMNIYTPVTCGSLRTAISSALASGEPSAVRYPHAFENDEVVKRFYPDGDYSLRPARADFDSPVGTVIITDGRIVSEALKVEKITGDCGVVLLEKLKPYADTAKAIADGDFISDSTRTVVFLEEEIKNGGMGMLLSAELGKLGLLDGKKVIIMATDDNFVIRRKDEPIYKTAGIDADSIIEKLGGQDRV